MHSVVGGTKQMIIKKNKNKNPNKLAKNKETAVKHLLQMHVHLNRFKTKPSKNIFFIPLSFSCTRGRFESEVTVCEDDP
jgi:hypothetical protein